MMAVDQPPQMAGETVYGEEILRDELDRLDAYAVITSRTPWALHAARLPKRPVAVVMSETLERSELETISGQVPRGARIVGLGGGAVIDAAKYFAYLRGEGVMLAPTVSSSNGPFSDWISVRRNGRPDGFRDLDLPRRIVVDYALIERAQERVNRAGYGDLLPLQTTLNDWRIAAAASRGTPVDAGIEAAATELMRQAIASAREIGALGRGGIERLMRLTEASTALMLAHGDHPINAGSEHLFAWTLESLTGRHFLHGEIVALGIVISSYLQQRDHSRLRTALDEAGVMHRPAQLGLEWDEIERTLLCVGAYNREVRRYNTIYDDMEWTPALLGELREVAYSH